MRGLIHPNGMKRHLSLKDIPRRLFGQHVEQTTQILKQAEAHRLGQPVIYVASSRTRKESLVKEVLCQNPVDRGLTFIARETIR